MLSQRADLPALKGKERTAEIGFQALAFRILFDDFQINALEISPPLSGQAGSPALFYRSTEPILKTVLMWFCCAFLHVTFHFQILAHEAGCHPVP